MAIWLKSAIHRIDFHWEWLGAGLAVVGMWLAVLVDTNSGGDWRLAIQYVLPAMAVAGLLALEGFIRGYRALIMIIAAGWLAGILELGASHTGHAWYATWRLPLAAIVLAATTVLLVRRRTWAVNMSVSILSLLMMYAFDVLKGWPTSPVSIWIVSNWLFLCGGLTQSVATELDFHGHVRDRVRLLYLKSQLARTKAKQLLANRSAQPDDAQGPLSTG